MRVAVTGANGAVGRAILRATPSHAPAVDVVAAVRSERAAAALRPDMPAAARIARVEWDDAATLHAAFAGASAVVHLAGILVARAGATYEQANVETTRRVAEAAGHSGVQKLVLVSAIGADAAAANAYWRTKGQAEAVVAASGLCWTVVRVPMLLGRGTEAAVALRRRAECRAVALLGGGRTLHQPLDVDDLARAALAACARGVADARTLELVGPVSLPERALVERAARLLRRRIRVIPVPAAPARLAAGLLWRLAGRGVSPDVLEVLTTDTRLDPAPAAHALGIALTGLDATLRASVER
jgi:uncharacterized protein YbjT (DUF2867 family)